MANFTVIGSKLNLKVKTGEKEGKAIFRTLSLNNIKSGASADQLTTLTTAIESILDFPIVEAVKIESNRIDA